MRVRIDTPIEKIYIVRLLERTTLGFNNILGEEKMRIFLGL